MLKFAIPMSGIPGPTTRIVVGDIVDNLADEYDSPINANPCVGAVITCEVGDIRFTMGGVIATPTIPPTQGVAGLGHILYEGQSLVISSGPAVRTFQFIALTNGVAATLQVTCLFEQR
jgi:hypothetical protein